jgi:hypothetical protein
MLDFSHLKLPRLEWFEPLIGQGFRIDYPDYQETLTLVSAEGLKQPRLMGLPPGFILIFHGENPATMLGQALYTLHNPVLGPLDISLSCIGRQPDGTFRYQAVFN